MTIEAILLWGTFVVFGALALPTIIRLPRDSWDKKPDDGADDWDPHKATLGIYQAPGDEQWQKDLAALRFDRKHPYC